MSRWTRPFSRATRREISNRLPVPVATTRGGRLFNYAPSTHMDSFMSVYGTDAVVHPIVSRLAESTSEAEWRLWTKSASGDKQDRRQVNSHAVLDLMEKPNDFQSLSEIMESGQQHFDLVGETSIVLGFTPGISLPLDMWVLRPDRIQPVPSADNFLDGWIYTSPDGGEKIPLEVRELMRMRRPNPQDPYRGMGPIQALLRDLDAQRFTKEWQASFFANSARPGGMLKVDRRLTDDEFEEMAERWGQQHQGVSKAHRVAILEQAEWVENAFSLKDLQIAELESVGRDKALVAFGMPKSVLGIVEDVNRANAEAGEYLFARWMVRPRLARWRSMFNRQLLPLYGGSRRIELDFEDPVPENSEQAISELDIKSKVVVALVGAGFDAPEVLDLVDWPDLAYTAPPPPTIKVPSRLGEEQPAIEPGEPEDALVRTIDNAMRWVVTGIKDANCCDPCEAKIGTTYRNRASAYADYPPGEGYLKCVGREFGNKCRCSVKKRRSGRDE